jgi:hypothetical protein
MVLRSVLEASGDEPWLEPTRCWYCERPATLGLHHTSPSGNRVDVCRRHREEGLRQLVEWDAPLLGVYLLPLGAGRGLPIGSG